MTWRVEVTSLTKAYRDVAALRDVSFAVSSGATVGVLGPNGAGKSTLLHCLTGLVVPDAGTITIAGAPSGEADLHSWVGFAPDDLPMPDLLTGWELLDLVASLRAVQVDAGQLRSYARAFRLDGSLNRLVGDYSHGMRRKLSLLAAMMHSPQVLVLDEPLRGLDPESGAIVKQIIASYRASGRAVILSTHDMLLAEQLCDDVLVLHHGRSLAFGTVAAIGERTDTADLERAFLALTGLERDVREAMAHVVAFTEHRDAGEGRQR